MTLEQKQKKTKNLQFNKDKHEYSLDGKVIPSVSEIMRPLTKDYYSKIPKPILEKARDRGLGVHQAIEDYIMFDVISEEYKGYVEQFIKATVDNDLFVLHNELMITDGEYAGTIDLLANNNDGFVLVDIKATSKINTDLLKIQLSAYRLLLEKNGYNIKGCYVLHLKEDKYVFKQIEPDDQKWGALLSEYKNEVHEYQAGDEAQSLGEG